MPLRRPVFLPPENLSLQTEQARQLLACEVNMTLSTVNWNGTPWATTLTAVFRPTDSGVVAEWYSEQATRHSRNLRRFRLLPWTIGRATLTLCDSKDRLVTSLTMTGRARTVPLTELNPQEAQALLTAHNMRRTQKNPDLPPRNLDEFLRLDNPMQLWEMPVESATVPVTARTPDGRTRMCRAPLPLPALATFGQPPGK